MMKSLCQCERDEFAGGRSRWLKCEIWWGDSHELVVDCPRWWLCIGHLPFSPMRCHQLCKLPPARKSHRLYAPYKFIWHLIYCCQLTVLALATSFTKNTCCAIIAPQPTQPLAIDSNHMLVYLDGTTTIMLLNPNHFIWLQLPTVFFFFLL